MGHPEYAPRGEPYIQWVLEDTFTAGRPPYEDAGVQVVDDVEPYELMKLRLLNASHQALAYFGRLLGHRMVHDAALSIANADERPALDAPKPTNPNAPCRQ